MISYVWILSGMNSILTFRGAVCIKLYNFNLQKKLLCGLKSLGG